jgi:hypothetical protein
MPDVVGDSDAGRERKVPDRSPDGAVSHSAKPEIAYGQHESGGRPGRGFLSRSQGAAFSGGFNRPSRNRVFGKYFKTCSLSIYK